MQFDTRTRVQIAHCDAIVSAGLAALLGDNADMQLVLDAVQADVLILDHKAALEHMRRCADMPHQEHQHEQHQDALGARLATLSACRECMCVHAPILQGFYTIRQRLSF